jgi:hypothetical protein
LNDDDDEDDEDDDDDDDDARNCLIFPQIPEKTCASAP